MDIKMLQKAIEKYADGDDDVLTFFRDLMADKGTEVLALVTELEKTTPVDQIVEALEQNEGDLDAVREEFEEEEGLPADWEAARKYVDRGVPMEFVLAVAKNYGSPTREAVTILDAAQQIAVDPQHGQQNIAAMTNDPNGMIARIRDALAAQGARQAPSPPPARPMAPPPPRSQATAQPITPLPSPTRRHFQATQIPWKNIGIGCGVFLVIVLLVAGIGFVAVNAMNQPAPQVIVDQPKAAPKNQQPPVQPVQPAAKTELPSVGVFTSPTTKVQSEHVLAIIAGLMLLGLGLKDAWDSKARDYVLFIILMAARFFVDLLIGLQWGWSREPLAIAIRAGGALVPFAALAMATRPGTGRDANVWDGKPLGLGLGAAGLWFWLTGYLPGITEFMGYLPPVTPIIGNEKLLNMIVIAKQFPKELFSTGAFVLVTVLAIILLVSSLHREMKQSKRAQNLDLVMVMILTAPFIAQPTKLFWYIIAFIVVIVALSARQAKQMLAIARTQTQDEAVGLYRIMINSFPEEEIGILILLIMGTIAVAGGAGEFWPPAPFR